VSKRTREHDVASDLIDSEFERALEENELRGRDRSRRVEQKTQQLCRQVQRALNMALAGEFSGGTLGDAFVVQVSPVTGGGRLVVHVGISADGAVSEVLGELRNRAPRLRAVVAGYISRKRAPELSFAIARLEGDAHG
jgi:hypothetical protein